MWLVRPTGDMTLSIVDTESGVQMLKVDMLTHRTMHTGSNGERLARTWNDLSLIASLPESLRPGLSPGPWTVHCRDNQLFIEVRTPEGRLATRRFPASSRTTYQTTKEVLLVGMERVNQVLAYLT
jgi:hypothetical protein